jgi:hypothetical protein
MAYNPNDPILNRPSNKIEAELTYPAFILRVAGKELALSYLVQQALETANPAGQVGLINPLAHGGLIPFQQGRVSYYLPIPDIKLPNLDELFGSLMPKTQTSFLPQRVETQTQIELTKVPKQKRVKTELSVQFATIAVNDQSKITIDKAKTAQKEQDNFIFFFKSLNSTTDDAIFFRAYIKAVNENLNPNWSSKDVFGRPRKINTFVNVTRNVNLEFNIVIDGENSTKLNQSEFVLFRDSLNWLARHTQFVIESNGYYKEPSFLQMTIGTLYQNINGFINKLDYDHNFMQRWDTGKQFPHGTKVNLGFTVVEQDIKSNIDSEKLY